ncbi:MAG: hypothetical protein ACKPKO_55325, partial [Candidatus Fonsibacter sp.]
MTYGGGPSGGYIIDYSIRPPRVFRWRRGGIAQPLTIVALRDSIVLLYRRVIGDDPPAYVCEFTINEVRQMDIYAQGYHYAYAAYFQMLFELPDDGPEEEVESVEDNNNNNNNNN